MSTPSILDDLKKWQDWINTEAIKSLWENYYGYPYNHYYPINPIPAQPHKETPVIKTETKTVTTKTLGSFTLELHQDGTAAIKGLWDEDGKRIETQRYSKEYLKNLYKLLGEVVVG